MSFSVQITLTTAGIETGAFDLYSNIDGYATAFETNISRATLLAGYTSNLVPDGTTIIKCKSNTSKCTNAVLLNISGLPVGPTPTPTNTSTPTATPTATPNVTLYQIYLGYSTVNGYTACSDYNPSTDYFWSDCATLDNGCHLHITSDPTSAAPPEGYYSDGTNWYYFVGGTLYSKTSCIAPTPTMTPTQSLPPVGVGIYTGATFASPSAACADTNYPNGTLYIAHGDTISDGDILYTDLALTIPFNGASNNYRIYQSGFYGCTIGTYGTVSNLSNCSATPTPTATATPTATPITPYYQVDILKGVAGDCSVTNSACYYFNSGVTPDNTIYTATGALSNGITAYSDALGTTPFNGGPGAGYYYSDGSSYARINSSGLITVVGPCGPGCP